MTVTLHQVGKVSWPMAQTATCLWSQPESLLETRLGKSLLQVLCVSPERPQRIRPFLWRGRLWNIPQSGLNKSATLPTFSFSLIILCQTPAFFLTFKTSCWCFALFIHRFIRSFICFLIYRALHPLSQVCTIYLGSLKNTNQKAMHPNSRTDLE